MEVDQNPKDEQQFATDYEHPREDAGKDPCAVTHEPKPTVFNSARTQDSRSLAAVHNGDVVLVA